MIQIRPAQPEDATTAAALLASAYTHTQHASMQQKQDNNGWTEHLKRYFRRANTRFSYPNILVAEHNAEVVGLVLSFGGRDEKRLNAAVGKWLEREARDDEWYIDALAVFGDWGNQGIGTRLLEHAEQLARKHDYPNIALHVDKENTRALNLYLRLHYIATGHATFYHNDYIHVVKNLHM